MKQIDNIKDFIATENEDGYIIHITFDELIAIESSLENDIELIKEDAENEQWIITNKNWVKQMLNIREEMIKKLQEVRRECK